MAQAGLHCGGRVGRIVKSVDQIPKEHCVSKDASNVVV